MSAQRGIWLGRWCTFKKKRTRDKHYHFERNKIEQTRKNGHQRDSRQLPWESIPYSNVSFSITFETENSQTRRWGRYVFAAYSNPNVFVLIYIYSMYNMCFFSFSLCSVRRIRCVRLRPVQWFCLIWTGVQSLWTSSPAWVRPAQRMAPAKELTKEFMSSVCRNFLIWPI